jgi:hypothetical protein
VEFDTSLDNAGSLPYLPITLQYQNSLSVQGLLDTGATVNVLPYSIGTQLGAVWEQQTIPVKLTGNLANFEARVLIVSATIGNFAPVRLAFAWTQSDNIPLLLGQVNFFMEFDVCFYRSQFEFEIRPKAS